MQTEKMAEPRETGLWLMARHFNDADGNPAGGCTQGNGFVISWQNGPLGRGESRIGPNGAFVETVIQAVISRLGYYQQSKFHCEENQRALEHLYQALECLTEGIQRRSRR